MLMECLAAGRAITLPASAVGGAKVLAYTGVPTHVFVNNLMYHW